MKGMNQKVFLVKGRDAWLISLAGKSSDHKDDDPNNQIIWTYGDIDEAHADVAKESGRSNYNVEISFAGGKFIMKGVLASCGKVVFVMGLSNELDIIEWISEEDFIALKEGGDPADSPSCPYKVQPEYQGKLLWLTGPPCAGKSTTAQFLSKIAGFVYYEADAFFNALNPYIPIDVAEPSLAIMKQKTWLNHHWPL